MNIDAGQIEILVNNIVKKIIPEKFESVAVGVSNRHIHLSKQDLEFLFGNGYSLNKLKDLKQPEQFAAKETLTLVGPKGAINNVRILGPARSQTQVEISRTDAFALGLNVPVRISGNVKNTPGCVLIGPKNSLVISEGVIIAANHLHLSEEEAKKLNLKNGQKIVVRSVAKERKIFFSDVVVRCGKEHSEEFHIDTDEANCALLNSGDKVEIVF
ncbi:MAG TPA: phosphate propanoyltransferase [bacterium]|nr:phosphate propanoyltransferase [bacterium]HPN32556.1 phosphate propanoyltransferase [bacterium]